MDFDLLRPNSVDVIRWIAWGKGRAFDYSGDRTHELFSPPKVKMQTDSESIFRPELSWNMIANM